MLDGGLATELERRGADLRDPLWSARVLVEDPSGSARSTRRTSTPARTSRSRRATRRRSRPRRPRARGGRGGRAHAPERRARPRGRPDGHVVAASVGPTARCSATAPSTPATTTAARTSSAFHVPRMEALAEAEPDLFAIETIPSIVEARALVRALERVPGVPAWVSFSCRDGGHICDGTLLEEAVAVATARRTWSPSGSTARRRCTPPRSSRSRRRGRSPGRLLPEPRLVLGSDAQVLDRPAAPGRPPPLRPGAWSEAGARLIGGCCGTTPEDIEAVAGALGRG